MQHKSLIDALSKVVGDRGVVTEVDDLVPFSHDWRHMFHGRPLCAVLPRNTQEVSDVVRLCVAAGVAIVPFGGNTGLSGGATPDQSGQQVVLSLTRMSAIRDIDVMGETIEVEAGCILQTAQEAVDEKGLLLPITLAAEGSARIGGIVSTNAGGTNVLRYGMARSRVLGLEVVTADGQIINGLRRLRKDNAGYDWKQWFIGTEGTLGIVTAAVLQLTSKPRYRVTALLAVSSAANALKLLCAARGAIGETLTGFELMSGAALARVTRHLQLKVPLGQADWYVLLEASSSLPGLRDATEVFLGEVLENEIASDGVVAESEKQEADLWALRESITEAEGKEGRSVKHDVSVPISAIPEFLQVADEAVMRIFPEAQINAFGHIGDGNLHYNVIVPQSLDALALNQLIHDVVGTFGGSISAEHGIGQYRVDELTRCRAPAELAIARQIKVALDPQNLLNPGKVFSNIKP
ncbi:hydroxyacid dehydrogenase [Limnohabitans sp. TS-CS-82]|jgi:FAD/FMN-containing dehydrogenase|uniref:FAD-binding oxidoreductase n=1 Tax=Limnohabitans sp. TS-CS-82 TaxID=2094193 RepID=UPI000CF2C599|nr:FAD-binding oxidoreductase [Limnohabitans sp. TS-CS-82]PQA80480.1 hydroxyacid dehydrogenase [Limnohabitans sp. TS-CS-82]